MGSKKKAPERSFYTLAEAAGVLGVHYETAARWARSGKLPAVKLSRRKVVVRKEECAALVRSGSEPKAPVRFGDPRQWLTLAGIMTAEEAAQVRANVEATCEQIEDTIG